MAKASACTVATVSAMIQRLTGSVASGARNMLLAPIPLAWQERAAFQSLVAKLRYPSTRFSSILMSRPWLSMAAMKKRSASADRKRVVQGKGVAVRVDLGGRRFIKKKKK